MLRRDVGLLALSHGGRLCPAAILGLGAISGTGSAGTKRSMGTKPGTHGWDDGDVDGRRAASARGGSPEPLARAFLVIGAVCTRLFILFNGAVCARDQNVWIVWSS
ncbi:hypothetical protein FB451DRAFT_1231530 [Mycena latifolia]|nr:hypothetical protein FB451DRAFT_1231530 [Mycena latifolia]